MHPPLSSLHQATLCVSRGADSRGWALSVRWRRLRCCCRVGEWVTSCGVSCVCKLDPAEKASEAWGYKVDTHTSSRLFPRCSVSFNCAFASPLFRECGVCEDDARNRGVRGFSPNIAASTLAAASWLTNASSSVGTGGGGSRSDGHHECLYRSISSWASWGCVFKVVSWRKYIIDGAREMYADVKPPCRGDNQVGVGGAFLLQCSVRGRQRAVSFWLAGVSQLVQHQQT